jgi:hypothetical protein
MIADTANVNLPPIFDIVEPIIEAEAIDEPAAPQIFGSGSWDDDDAVMSPAEPLTRLPFPAARRSG